MNQRDFQAIREYLNTRLEELGLSGVANAAAEVGLRYESADQASAAYLLAIATALRARSGATYREAIQRIARCVETVDGGHPEGIDVIDDDAGEQYDLSRVPTLSTAADAIEAIAREIDEGA